MLYQSKRRVIVELCLCTLVLLVIIGVVTPVRDSILNHFFPPAGAAIAPIPAGDNLFYIQATPPGHISIDGRLVTHLPSLTKNPPDAPFPLARGSHQIVWEALPFQPEGCAVSVPSQLDAGTCKYETLIQDSAGQTVHVITFTPSFDDLSVTQQNVLTQRIQDVLQPLNATAMVLPGEQYFYTSPAGATSFITATQPLQASVTYHLDTSLTSTRGCVDGYGDTCIYNGQNCLKLCVITDVESVSGGGATLTPVNGPDWYAVALFYATWTYRTAQGVLVAGHQSDYFDRYVGIDHSLLLHLLWNNGVWSVNLVPTISQLNLISIDPACASLNGLVSATTTYALTHDSHPTNVSWNVYAGTNRAEGCLGVATLQQSQQPLASFLFRFGVLLAVNSAAHQYFPELPVADANEQAIAQQIATQEGV